VEAFSPGVFPKSLVHWVSSSTFTYGSSSERTWTFTLWGCLQSVTVLYVPKWLCLLRSFAAARISERRHRSVNPFWNVQSTNSCTHTHTHHRQQQTSDDDDVD
jgi:hypothetical protein